MWTPRNLATLTCVRRFFRIFEVNCLLSFIFYLRGSKQYSLTFPGVNGHVVNETPRLYSIQKDINRGDDEW